MYLDLKPTLIFCCLFLFMVNKKKGKRKLFPIFYEEDAKLQIYLTFSHPF